MSAADCKRSYLYAKDPEQLCEECGFACADHQFAGTLRVVLDLMAKVGDRSLKPGPWIAAAYEEKK